VFTINANEVVVQEGSRARPEWPLIPMLRRLKRLYDPSLIPHPGRCSVAELIF